MIGSIQDVAFLAGIILGACLLVAVSWVWMRKQVLGASGISLAVIGFALVGLTVWTAVTVAFLVTCPVLFAWLALGRRFKRHGQ